MGPTISKIVQDMPTGDLGTGHPDQHLDKTGRWTDNPVDA